MIPLSYQGFGFTAILVMVAILSAGQLLKYLKERFHQPQGQKHSVYVILKDQSMNVPQHSVKKQSAAMPSANNFPSLVSTSFSLPVLHLVLTGYKSLHYFPAFSLCLLQNAQKPVEDQAFHGAQGSHNIFIQVDLWAAVFRIQNKLDRSFRDLI